MSPIKHNADSMQNSSNFPSQPKGKKRSRSDQTSESKKRDNSVKHNGGESVQLRSDNLLKSEISKLAAKGLVDSDSVDKLVQLMQPEKSHRKMDLSFRSMLAGILAASDRLDCLNLFVQRRGLTILDEWLKEVQKGKVGSSAKDGDKQVEDFLLVLLNALDKLPVNLNALQMCNIGKSVNHLRSHKSVEIHKRARSLVDTWKQRVEAEMNNYDAKSSSSPEVPVPARSKNETSCDWKKHSSTSSEALTKTSGQLSSPKSAAAKLVQGETTGRTSSASSGIDKSSSPPGSVNANLKQGQPKMSAIGGCSEPPPTVREEKSSTSSQSHTNSQYSSELARKSGKEDANSSTAGSRSMNRTRHRKSANGLQVAIPSGADKESGAGKHATVLRNQVSHSTITCENASTSVPKNNKMIIKIHNRGCSPGKSSTAGPANEITCSKSRASSPALSQKCDQSDAVLKKKSTKCEDNATLPDAPVGQSIDQKDSEANTSTAGADNPSENYQGKGKKQANGIGPSSGAYKKLDEIVNEAQGTVDGTKQIHMKAARPKDEEDSATDEVVGGTGSVKAEEVVKEKTSSEEEETGDSSLPSMTTKADAVFVSENAAKLLAEDTSEIDASDLVDTKMKQRAENDVSSDHPGNEESFANAGDKIDCKDNILENLGASPAKELEGQMSSVDQKKDIHSSAAAIPSPSASGVPDNDKKLEFDLNEGFDMDEMKPEELIHFAASSLPTSSLSPVSGFLPASAERLLFPPEEPLRNKTELGWKGFAATSAFRPAEPRAPPQNQARHLLEIDLNVTDERVLQDITINSGTKVKHKPDSGGFQLDLNRVDEDSESGQYYSFSTSGAAASVDTSTRDFDLNNGPALDEKAAFEPPLSLLQAHSNNNNNNNNNTPQPQPQPQPQLQPHFGIRMNRPMLSSKSTWDSPGTTYSAVTVATPLPDNRGDHPFPIMTAGPQRILSGLTSTSFNPDFYRGPTLSSSPLQYPVFPFGTSFPSLPGGYMDPTAYSGAPRFYAPAFPAQFMGSAAAIPSQYLRPGMVGIPDNAVGQSLVRQGLDLNSGPGGTSSLDVEGRDRASLNMSMRQFGGVNPQALPGEQARSYHGLSKRKEPDGGWDAAADANTYKQSSWRQL